MNKYEIFFLESGFNWTLSKALPYGLLLLAGALVAFLILKKLPFGKKWLKRLIALIAFPCFFLFYFLKYPIYEGDFSNGKRVVKEAKDFKQINANKLTVIALPNCPFCYEAMDRMLYLKKRDPKMVIEYLVCSDDSTTMDWYKEKAGNKIKVILSSDPTAISELANHSFPSFVLRNPDSSLTVWSNDSFGVLAMDEVESTL